MRLIAQWSFHYFLLTFYLVSYSFDTMVQTLMVVAPPDCILSMDDDPMINSRATATL